ADPQHRHGRAVLLPRESPGKDLLAMRSHGRIMKTSVLVVAIACIASPALAGRGGTYGEIVDAINSTSPGAIKAALERAEYLTCAACVDAVKPLLDNSDRGVRRVAAWFLARRMNEDLVNEMVARLNDVNSERARNAANALGELQRPEAIAPLAT